MAAQSGKPLRGLETNPFFTMSMSWPRLAAGQFIWGRDRYRLLRSTAERRSGGARRNRTDDLKLAKLALSQLSYGPAGIRT
jgi:hypothetical protein